jgi:hypothetical protein
VSSEVFEGFTEVGWRPEDETVTTAVFDERDGKTIWTATIRYPSQEVRDAALRSDGAWRGMAESFERLEAAIQPEA